MIDKRWKPIIITNNDERNNRNEINENVKINNSKKYKNKMLNIGYNQSTKINERFYRAFKRMQYDV